MALKPKITEEFLWKFYELIEAIDDAHRTLAPRTLKDVLHPEWRELRLAYKKKRQKKSFSQFVSYLKRSGYIKIPTGKSVYTLQLTERGRQKALRGMTQGKALQPRKDGKMIMLMYDIPEAKRRIRKMFRSLLEFLDYQMLQKSVWVSDRDVLEETERAVREYNLHSYVNIFIIEKVRVQT